MDFELIYKEFFKIIYSYIISRVRNEAVAQDLAAVTWEKVLKKLDTYNQSKGNMRQWLFTIARNEINMHYRLYYVKKFFSLSDFEENSPAQDKEISQSMEDEQERQTLLNAMGSLNDKERDIIALKFYSGLNNREIAALINISESNTGTIINRAITKLRVLLEAK